MISLDKALEITHVSATVGDNVEIKCDVSGSPPMPIVWRRYGVDLSSLNQEDQVRVFLDGSLYLNKIQLLHAGNYSCHAQRNQEVVQTHILSVQSKSRKKFNSISIHKFKQYRLELIIETEKHSDRKWLPNFQLHFLLFLFDDVYFCVLYRGLS